MAVSGKTAAPWEIPYLEESDIPDMGAGDKAIAERLHAILAASNQRSPSWLKKGSKGQIIVCNSSGTPQYVTPSGDVSLSESGDFEIGKGTVGIEEIADKAITLEKLAESLKKELQPAKLETIKAAEEIEPSYESNLIKLEAGSGTVKKIKGTYDGHTLIFRFAGKVEFVDGAGLSLASNFVGSGGDTLTVIYDSSINVWYETSRSEN